jgi:integrin alpha FG-GAP repeat containing protein 1
VTILHTSRHNHFSSILFIAPVGQLPQTSYQSLLTPYSFSGLGRTNNYIENLFVGSTKHIPQHYINMEGVIPNSKVVILPPPGETEDGWKRELFLRPGEWIPWVTVTVVVATIILAAIVGVLHWDEKVSSLGNLDRNVADQCAPFSF